MASSLLLCSGVTCRLHKSLDIYASHTVTGKRVPATLQSILHARRVAVPADVQQQAYTATDLLFDHLPSCVVKGGSEFNPFSPEILYLRDMKPWALFGILIQNTTFRVLNMFQSSGKPGPLERVNSITGLGSLERLLVMDQTEKVLFT